MRYLLIGGPFTINSLTESLHINTKKRALLITLLPFIIMLLITTSGVIEAAKRPYTQSPYVIHHKKYFPIPNADGYREVGLASWYGRDFHGRKTSNGEIYNMYKMTAAHKTLPMNTMLLVRNLENGRETVVRVNDRGPFVRGRIIDLSYKTAKHLGVVAKGTAKVQIIALAEGTLSKRGKAPILIYKDLSIGEFYVQIGAFTRKINAITLQKRFTEAGHTTVIQKYYGPSNILYRVQVYAGKSLQNAKRAARSLHEHGYSGSFIIAR